MLIEAQPNIGGGGGGLSQRDIKLRPAHSVNASSFISLHVSVDHIPIG